MSDAGKGGAMARKRKRKPGGRGNPSKHPGVVLLLRERKGVARWRARYIDPETGRKVLETLEATLSSEEIRTEWAKKKSATLAARRAEIATGAPIRTVTGLQEAVDTYLAACGNRLRARTVSTYRESLGHLTDWANRRGIATVEAVGPQHIADFRQDLIAQRVKRPGKGKRGAKRETTEPRRPAYLNRIMRETGAFLGEARRMGRTPFLSRDSIADGLRALPLPRTLPRPLAPNDCKTLMLAAIGHDAETWKITRREHAANPSAAAVHGTPRYRPVAPLAAFVLLSGCRIGEALSLKWEDVNLDAPGEDGQPVGEVRLLSGAVKTAQERIIDLTVAPGLRALLGRLRLRAGRDPYVFGGTAPYPRDDAENARKRMISRFDSPPFTWQRLRQTTASYLVNAPGVFRSAAIYRAAAQLGHSSAVADRHYRGVLRGIPSDARTVEAAMGIETILASIAPASTTTGSASATA